MKNSRTLEGARSDPSLSKSKPVHHVFDISDQIKSGTKVTLAEIGSRAIWFSRWWAEMASSPSLTSKETDRDKVCATASNHDNIRIRALWIFVQMSVFENQQKL
jgi:hypothetical protein